MKELLQALRPVKRRLRLNRLISGAAAGLIVGAAAALVLLTVTAFVPLENRWIIAALAAVGGMLLFAAGNALRKVRELDAARAADACGLRERAVTALELAEKTDHWLPDSKAAELAEAQRQDACEHLRALDARQIRLQIPKRLLLICACLLVLCAATLLIPGGGDRIVAVRQELREKAAGMAKQIDEAEAAAEKKLSEQDKAELRRLTEDLKRELEDSRDSVDAMVALDKAEQRLEELRQKTAGEAMQQMADALQNAGLDTAAQAFESGDTAAMQAALSELTAAELQEATQGLTGEAKELAEQLAQAMQSGELTEAQLQAMMAGMSGSDALQQALAAMQAMLGGSGSQSGNQSGQGSAGSGAGEGQAGGGAGTGTTNEEQKGGGNSSESNGPVKGNNPAQYKEAQYETIYDPEKVDAATRDVATEQNALGKDSVQIETGPGKGTLDGSVPYREVVGEYAETEVQAAESAHLTQEQKQWVDEYFRKLTEE